MNRFRWIWKVAVVAMVAFLIFVAVSPLILFSLEEELLQEELNNPYINSAFEGWQETELPHLGRVMLPGAWSVTVEGDHFRIADADGTELGAGVSYRYAGDPYSSMGEALGIPEEKFNLTPEIGFVSINGSEYGLLTAEGTYEDARPYLILCKGTENSTILVFSAPRDDMLEIAQAISFSQMTLSD